MEKFEELDNAIREQNTLDFIKVFEKIKNTYFKEIYLDGQHWQLVMIAEDGFTIRLDLNIGE